MEKDLYSISLFDKKSILYPKYLTGLYSPFRIKHYSRLKTMINQDKKVLLPKIRRPHLFLKEVSNYQKNVSPMSSKIKEDLNNELQQFSIIKNKKNLKDFFKKRHSISPSLHKLLSNFDNKISIPNYYENASICKRNLRNNEKCQVVSSHEIENNTDNSRINKRNIEIEYNKYNLLFRNKQLSNKDGKIHHPRNIYKKSNSGLPYNNIEESIASLSVGTSVFSNLSLQKIFNNREGNNRHNITVMIAQLFRKK